MAVQLPPNSTGTVVDTVTVSSKDREIVVLGDPATAANVAGISAKGTQGAFALATQDLRDAGRAPVTYYMAAPVASTATDALLSLTGTKGAATVTATTTPAVVTTGKTLRVQRLWLTAIASATTSATAIIRLRYNTGGVVTATSPVLANLAVAQPGAVVGLANTEDATWPDGLEVPAGTGLGITVQSYVGASASATGAPFVVAGFSGYEY